MEQRFLFGGDAEFFANAFQEFARDSLRGGR
jgi:hypothetical protein